MIKKLSILLVVISSLVFATTLNFNGTSDYMSVADDPTFDVTTGLTVEAWVNKNAAQTGWRQVVTREKGTGIYDHWGLATNGTDWRGFINTTTGYTGNFSSSNPVTNGTWTHIALTFDGTDFSFYIDGTLVYSAPNSGTLEAGSQPILIGAASNNDNFSHVEYFDGKIDEVRVWDYARTVSEIQSTMYCPPTGSETGLILYLKNNEGSGTSVADETSNGNDGSIVSATWVTTNESPAPSQSTAAGNWATAGTWLSGQVPASVDYNCVEINHGVTLDDAARATGSLTMNSGSLDITAGFARVAGGALTIKNALTLTSGYIYTTASNTLTLATTATTSGGSSASFVDGPLKRMTDSTSDYYFPIGDGIASPVFQPLSLQPPSATADTWTGESHAAGFGSYGVFGTLSYVSTAEYWDLASANASIPDSLKLWWSSHSAFVSQGIDESNLTIAHYVTGVGLWLEEGRDDYSGIPSTSGWANTSPTFMSTFTFGKGTSLDNTVISDLPSDFGLNRVYPNPFNPITSIEYELPSMENVNISIFNINGQLVSTLVNDIQEAGSHSISWDGYEQPSGTYFLRMTSGDKVDTRKLMLIK